VTLAVTFGETGEAGVTNEKGETVSQKKHVTLSLYPPWCNQGTRRLEQRGRGTYAAWKLAPRVKAFYLRGSQPPIRKGEKGVQIPFPASRGGNGAWPRQMVLI